MANKFGRRGHAFFEDVSGSYQLNRDEQELLVELCRTLDAIEALAGLPVTVESARETRLQRGELRHLTAALGLPDDTGETVESGNTKRARRAAEARWVKDKENN